MNLTPSSTRAPWSWAIPAAALVCSCIVTPFNAVGEAPNVAAPPTAPVIPPLTAAVAKRADEPKEIRASHILVAYRGAMRAAPDVVRTKSEALTRAEEALKKAQTGADFKALTGEYSDEPGAAQSGGDLGLFPRDRVVPEFGNAAFALRPGELSGVVESPFGYHVILRTE